MAIDLIITEASAYSDAEQIARHPEATRAQLDAASAVLAQSPDWKQRILGREVRAGLYAMAGAELQTPVAVSAAQPEKPIDRYLAMFSDQKQVDWPVRPTYALVHSTGRKIAALALVFLVGLFLAVPALSYWWRL